LGASGIRSVGYRTAARAQNRLERNHSKEIFSQFVFRLTEPRGARFSPAADVITFSGLIHLTADHQSSSLEAFKINDMRSRQAAEGVT
jgi:hypothetical protein